jgi:thiol:disulfide interchange protein DsbD
LTRGDKTSLIDGEVVMAIKRYSLLRTIPPALALAASFLIPAPAPTSQSEEKVVEAKGLISRDAVRPGETFKAAVILKVQAGYHINDNAPLDEFMIPTALVVDQGQDFEVLEIAYPKGRRARFSYSETELVVYEGEAVLGVLVRAKPSLAAGPRVLKCALSYQACNNESCLPPQEVAFDIAVPIAVSGEGVDVHPEIFGKLHFLSQKK